MNTHTLYLSSYSTTDTITEDEIELFDITELNLDLSEVYSKVFPNYIAINWGDETPIEEPDITIYRNYKTDSIYPEVKNDASPVFLNNLYPHIYYPSDTALKKSMTLRVNVGYITGETTKFIIPINVRTEGYYENIKDLDLLNVSLLNNKDNKSIFTFLTEKDNFVIQNHNNRDIYYNTVGTINTLSSYHDTSLQSINETITLLDGVTDPVGAEAKFKFIENITDESATWSTNFWGYSNRSIYDFSGTSYNGSGFWNINNITLISPRHGIGVEHFSDDPSTGDVVYFYDQTAGYSVSSTIVDAVNTGEDLRVYSFDRDMSTATTSQGADSSIKLYKLPYFANEVPSDQFPVVYQAGNLEFGGTPGNYVVGYAGYGSHNFINRLSQQINYYGIFNNYSKGITVTMAPGDRDNPGLPDYRLTNVSPQLSSYNLSLSGVTNGDSGEPGFIVYDNELLLFTILQSRGIGGGGGRNFGNLQIQNEITSAMTAVGNSWGYKLSTVRLS